MLCLTCCGPDFWETLEKDAHWHGRLDQAHPLQGLCRPERCTYIAKKKITTMSEPKVTWFSSNFFYLLLIPFYWKKRFTAWRIASNKTLLNSLISTPQHVNSRLLPLPSPFLAHWKTNKIHKGHMEKPQYSTDRTDFLIRLQCLHFFVFRRH